MVSPVPANEITGQERNAPPSVYEQSEALKIPISGRFDKYRSSYWSGALAALGLRYLSRPFIEPFWTKGDITRPTSFLKTHSYSSIAGGIMEGVAAYYAMATYKDMRNIFAESVAWETGKDPKDVGFMDMWNSDNTVVQQTMSNFMRFNMRRALVNSAFFIPVLAHAADKYAPGLQGFTQRSPYLAKILGNEETGVHLGVASNAAHLFNDIVTRKVTAFEELQSIIDRKVNHSDRPSDRVTPDELVDIYERHAQNDRNNSFTPLRGTPQWNKSMRFFERMAELINQGYYNEPQQEKSNFGFSKFIYMMGHGMIDPHHIERSSVAMEIANLEGVQAARQAFADMRSGVSVQELADRYGISAKPGLHHSAETASRPAQKIINEKQHVGSFAAQESLKREQGADITPSLLS